MDNRGQHGPSSGISPRMAKVCTRQSCSKGLFCKTPNLDRFLSSSRRQLRLPFGRIMTDQFILGVSDPIAALRTSGSLELGSPRTPRTVACLATPSKAVIRPRGGSGRPCQRTPGLRPPGTELCRAGVLSSGRAGCTSVDTAPVSLLCGLPANPAAIPRRFSSSSLPPSFAWGRRTTVFLARGTTVRGAPLSWPGPGGGR